MSVDISFKQALEEEPKAALVPVENTLLAEEDGGKKALAFNNKAIGDIEGEFTTEHIKLPFVSIVQKTSDNALVKAFGMGSVVFNKEVKLCDDEGSWEMTPLRATLAYVQNVPFGQTPQRFASKASVLAAGGTTKFDKTNPSDINRYDENLYVQVAVRMPKGLDEELQALFPFSSGEFTWAMAMLGLKGGGFHGFGKLLIGHRANLLKDGLFHGRYQMSSGARSNDKGQWWVPEGRFIGKHTPEVAEYLRGLV